MVMDRGQVGLGHVNKGITRKCVYIWYLKKRFNMPSPTALPGHDYP